MVSLAAPMLLDGLDLGKPLSRVGSTKTAVCYEQLVATGPFSWVCSFFPKQQVLGRYQELCPVCGLECIVRLWGPTIF